MELELQVVVKHLTWVLETDLGSSGRAASTVNHLAVSPASTRVLTVEKEFSSWERAHGRGTVCAKGAEVVGSVRCMQGRHG